MSHADTHDPLTDWKRCWVCHQALSATFVTMADMDLGPRDMEQLIATMRRIAYEKTKMNGEVPA